MLFDGPIPPSEVRGYPDIEQLVLLEMPRFREASSGTGAPPPGGLAVAALGERKEGLPPG